MSAIPPLDDGAAIRATREVATLANQYKRAVRERDQAIERNLEYREALRGLLLSRDAAWTGGHDWDDAVKRACAALGIEEGEGV